MADQGGLRLSLRERAVIVAALCAGCGQDVPLDDAEVCGACFVEAVHAA